MLGPTLVSSLLVLCLCSPTASEGEPCFSLLAHRKSVKVTGVAFHRYPQFFRHTSAYLRVRPCRQIQRLISAPLVSNCVILRSVPPTIGLRLSHGLSTHTYCKREEDACRGVGRGRLSPAGRGRLSPAVTTVQTKLERAGERCRQSRRSSSDAVRTGPVDSKSAERPLPSPYSCINEKRKPVMLSGDHLAGDCNPALLSATPNARSTQGKFGKTPTRDASCMQSADAPKKGGRVGLQRRPPILFADMLLRQLQENIRSSSDALKVAFPKKYDRVTFRERVLSNLRQKAICATLGVTDDSAPYEDPKLSDSCSTLSTCGSQTPQDEAVMQNWKEHGKEDTMNVALRGNGKETLHSHTPTSSTYPPLIPCRGRRALPLRENVRTSDCGVAPKNSSVSFSYSISGLKSTDAAPAHPGTSSEDTNEALACNRTLKKFQFVAGGRCAAACHRADGKTHSAVAARKSSRGRQTASESLRGELGLHHRSDIVVQHISDLQRRPRISHPPRTSDRRKKLRCLLAGRERKSFCPA